MSPLTSIINFKHFYSFLASYSKIPTKYFYFERLLPGPMNTLNPGGNHLKQYFYFKWFHPGFRVFIGSGRSLSK